jgi:hypothetical protein
MTHARIVGLKHEGEAMSTATYERPLRVVPDIPATKARFASLLALRDAAERAFDKALSLPRSAIRWAIDLFHRWVEATGSIGVISWLSARARDAADLFRTAGIVPSVLAVLSMPPVAAAALRVAKFAGRGIVSVAKAAWTGIKGLLGRCGSTGTRIAEGLGRAGTYVADAVRSVAQHPMMAPVTQAVKATIALVRPVSWVLVTHRVLGALVPIVWLRAVVELLVMPFLVDSSLAGNVRDSVWTPGTDQTNGDVTSDGLLIDVLATPTSRSTNESAPGLEQLDDEEPPLNRASRRAQQRDDAAARRPQHPRR